MSKDKELYQDPIREKLIGFLENVYEKKNNILNGVLAFAFILGVIFYFNNISNVENKSANSEFGIAQNSYINGLQDFAMIEFENIAEEYPNINAGIMAKLYIASDLFYNGKLDEAEIKLSSLGAFDVEAIDANILGMRGDIALSKDQFDDAIKLYNEAKNTCELINYKIKFQIGEMYALQAKGDHDKVVSLATGLLGNDKISSSNKNIIDELLAFSQHFTM
jgi:predicted negative regulator of RcsB-dependent stress response